MKQIAMLLLLFLMIPSACGRKTTVVIEDPNTGKPDTIQTRHVLKND